MAGASEDGEMNYWPAFVDVLTAVIMVVTFLLVIMSAAIMELSKRTVHVMQQKMAAMQQSNQSQQVARPDHLGKTGATTGLPNQPPLSSPADAPAGSSVSSLGSPLVSESAVNGPDRLTILTRDTPDKERIAVKAVEEPPETRGARITSSSSLLRVDFDPDAVRYTDEDATRVSTFLKQAVHPGTKYEIWSFAPGSGSVSQPKRVAFYRAAMTRNLLIKAGIKPEDIATQMRVVDPMADEGNSVRIVVKN